MPDETPCLFCRIVRKEIPTIALFEDDDVLAFLDISPRAPGHTMVISKTHSVTILDLPDEALSPLFLGVKRATHALQNALSPQGFTIGINHGSISGQEVSHLHVHVIPRFTGDGGSAIQSVVNNPPKDSREELGKKIKAVA